MKFLLCIFLSSFSLFGHSQKIDLSNLFFNIPIYESRDSIYRFCTQNSIFTEKTKMGKTTRNGIEINTYFGTVKIDFDSANGQNIDSAQIQLSTGAQRVDGDSIIKYVIPISSSFFFSKKKSAKKYYSKVADQLKTITNFDPRNNKIYLNDKLIGYSEIWIKPTIKISSLSLEFVKSAKKYKVMIEVVIYE